MRRPEHKGREGVSKSKNKGGGGGGWMVGTMEKDGRRE